MRRVKITSLVLSLLLPLLTVGTASAQMVFAERPETIVRYLQNEGYRALLETDEDGRQYISSGINGWKYDIYFLDCDDDGKCHSLQFLMGFNLPQGTTLEAVNAFNWNYAIGNVSADEDMDPWLEWVVSTRGGLSKKNFTDVIDWWATVVGWFEDDFPFPDGDAESGGDTEE